MSTDPAISVVVVSHRRAHALAECLDSLATQTSADFEIVVVCNGANSEVEEVVASIRDARLRQLKLSPGVSASDARNRGVVAARADIIYFIDDDVLVPPGALAALRRTFAEQPKVDIVGGPNLTPPDDPMFAQMVGEVLASPLGTGVTRVRYVQGPEQPARERHLILCNLAVRRRVFEAGIRFPVSFGGEENVLMGHAEHQGFRLRYTPELWVHHRRRRTLQTYLSQVYRYGVGRALALRGAPATFHPAYLVPVGFTGYLIALPLLSLMGPVAALPLAVYGAAVSVESARIAVRRRAPGWLPALPPLFLATHVSYATGLALTLMFPPKASGEPSHVGRPTAEAAAPDSTR